MPSKNSTEPTALRGTILVAISSFLFGWFLSKPRAPINERTGETISPQDKTTKPEQGAKTLLAGTVQVANPIPEDNHSNRRADDAPLRKKIYEWTVALGTIGLLIVNIFLLIATRKSAIAAQRAADSAVHTLIQERRPWIGTKMPSNFQIRVGAPITTDIEIVNYGKSGALARTVIHIDTSPGIIDKFRDSCKNDIRCCWIPDEIGTFTSAMAPSQSIENFPVESVPKTLTQQDYDNIMNGTMNVVVYGRIWYSGLGQPTKEAYNSMFCFYRMRNGSVSACPNQEHAYTNYMP